MRLLARPRSESALCALLEQIRDLDIPFVVLGGGSNVLALDGPWKWRSFSFTSPATSCCAASKGQKTKNSLRGSGTKLQELIRYCIENGLEGLESLSGIPGTVGGALVMNAGTPSGAISDNLLEVDLVGPDGRRRSIRREELTPGYRTMGIPENSIVLGACFKLGPCPSEIVKGRA